MHAPTQLLGHQIGPYRIMSFLGAGGMAEVFVGEHVDPQLARRVAIKALRTELCQDPILVERFVNEARALGRIRHPGVVDVYEVDRLPDGRVCLVMELLRGETLLHYLAARGRLPVDEAVAIASQVAAAMRAAHHVGIIHRDLKPDNVFVAVEPEGLRVRVLDFGVAKLLDGAGAVVTGTKSTLGTAAYMAPEQFRSSRDVDARVDVYALGCMLFQMIAGAPPYPAKGLAEQMAGHAFAPIPSLVERVGAPPVIDAILARMLAKQREDRYASMDDVLHALTPGNAEVSAPTSIPPGPPAPRPEAVSRPVAGVETARVATGTRSWIPLIVVAVAVGAAIAAGLALR